MRLLKVIKMAHIRPELMWWFQYSRHANLLRLLYLFSFMVILVHYIACIFMMVLGDKSDKTDPGEMPTWMELQECKFSDNTDSRLRRMASPPEDVCLSYRDTYYTDFDSIYYAEDVDDPKPLTERLRPLADRLKPVTIRFLNLNQTFVDDLVTTYSQAALDDCLIDGDLYGTCSNTDKTMSYTTAYYFSMLLIMGESIGPSLIVEKWFATIIILIGSIIIAYIYGNVSMYIANFTANQTAYQRKMEVRLDIGSKDGPGGAK